MSLPQSGAGPVPPSAARWLHLAAWLFAAAVVLHNFDHARRGVGELQAEVYWIGSAVLIPEIGALVLLYGRHRLAALGAVTVGLPLAAGYAFVHFTPQRGWFSDSLLHGAPVDVWTWAAAGLQTTAALALGVAGMFALVRAGGLSTLAGRRETVGDPWHRGLRHPVVVTFTVINLAIIAATLPSL